MALLKEIIKMDYSLLVKILQIILSVFLVLLILIQSKGKGLTSGIGDSIGMYRSRRGLEKAVFVMTIALAVLVVINSLLIVILS